MLLTYLCGLHFVRTGPSDTRPHQPEIIPASETVAAGAGAGQGEAGAPLSLQVGRKPCAGSGVCL